MRSSLLTFLLLLPLAAQAQDQGEATEAAPSSAAPPAAATAAQPAAATAAQPAAAPEAAVAAEAAAPAAAPAPAEAPLDPTQFDTGPSDGDDDGDQDTGAPEGTGSTGGETSPNRTDEGASLDPPPLLDRGALEEDPPPEAEPPAPEDIPGPVEPEGLHLPVPLPFAPHSFGRAFRLGVLALLLLALSLWADRLRHRLAPTGFLPTLASTVAAVCRTAFVPLVVLSFFALTPASWGWAEPVLLVVVAGAAGWSSRDVLGDLFAGMVLGIESPFHPGQRVRVAEVEGRVLELGPRNTRLALDDGSEIAIPNRRITRGGWSLVPEVTAVVELVLSLPPSSEPHRVRQVLREIALSSPWIAAEPEPEITRSASGAGQWRVRAHLVHPRFADAFEGALVEQADELLGSR